jgi:hypothetical protein
MIRSVLASTFVFVTAWWVVFSVILSMGGM